jgi:hypothetical protein
MLERRRRVEPRSLAKVAFMAAAAVAAAAQAADVEPSESMPAVEIHGFVSQGAIRSTGNDYLVPDSKRGSFDFNEAGINFTTQLTDRLRVGMQLFAYDLGTLGNYSVTADWYTLDYRLRDWFGLRAGRLKLPLGLYNDVSDIDAARVSILLPSSLYPATNRDFFLAQTGAELYGYLPLGRAGALDYRVFGGSVAINLPSQIGAPTQISNLGIPIVGGTRVMWETPLEGLRAGVTFLALRVDATIVVPAPALPLTEKENIYSAFGSLEYTRRDLLLQSELGQQRTESTITSTPSPTTAVVSEGAYLLAAYRLARWLQPGAYCSLYYVNRNLGNERQNIQDDLAATLRFDINAFWLVKLEAHYMHGTALVADAAAMQATDPEDWGLFLIKTTAYF